MSTKHFFIFYASKLFYIICPCRVKRMIFWATMVGHLQLTFKDPNFLNKTNKALSLSSDTEALKLPTFLGATIWGKNASGNTLKQYLINKDVKVKKAFLTGLPDWIKYASSDKIERDVDVFIQSTPIYI